MKLTVERRALLKAMQMVGAVVERTTTIPILSHVKLDAKAGAGVALTATDLDIQFAVPVVADVSEGGSIALPAATLSDILRKLPDGSQIELKHEVGRATLQAGRSRFSLNTLPPEDFPTLDAGTAGTRFDLEVAALNRMIDKTMFAVSTDETRYYLNGIHLHATRDKLIAVATDGHRLARCEVDQPKDAAGIPGIIIPRKTVQIIHKSLAGASGTVSLDVSASKLILEHEGARLVSKLIDGTFPDYERVIQRGNNTVAIADAKATAAMVDRVGTVAADRGNAVRLTFDYQTMTAEVRAPDAGEATDAMSIDYDGRPFSIGFNSRYLCDCLAQIDGADVRMELGSAGDPAIFKSAQGPDDLLIVVMPMRV